MADIATSMNQWLGRDDEMDLDQGNCIAISQSPNPLTING